MARLLFLVPLGVLLCGCGPMIEKRFFPKPTEPEMAREVNRLNRTDVVTKNVKPVSYGSLWPADDHVFFYADKKALRIGDRKSTRLNSSHIQKSRMPSSA